MAREWWLETLRGCSIGLVLVSAVSAFGQNENESVLDAEFNFGEQSWAESGGLSFSNQLIGSGANSWGNEESTDFYVVVDSSGGAMDNAIPSVQLVNSQDAIVMNFETQYLSSSNSHSYLAFGTGDDDSVWFGYGGGAFRAGTGTNFDLSSNTPGGVEVLFSKSQSLTSDTRIGIRSGFNVSTSSITNLQIDADNDGVFEIELMDEPVMTGAGVLFPEDWFLVTFAGRDVRADGALLQQLDLAGDYSSNLEFDAADIDLLCAGIARGDGDFDYNGDGSLTALDAEDYAWENGSLTGDFNFDGAVSFGDFLTLANNFGSAGLWSNGDATCDGQVGFLDFLRMATFFGNSTGGVREEIAAPEPNSGVLLMMGLFFCCARTHQKRR